MFLLGVFCYFGIAPKAQVLKKSVWLLYLLGDKAPTVARDISEAARVLKCRCYPQTANRLSHLVFGN